MYRMPPGFGPFGMGPASQFGQMMPFRGGFPAARPAGFLTRFLSPNPGGGLNLVSMVENAQKVMKMADTVRPIIQQYGPMVKNIPSMLELLKEYQSYSSSSDSDSSYKKDEKEKNVNSGKKKSSSKSSSKSSGNKKSSSKGLSTSTGNKSAKKPMKKKTVPKVKQVKPEPELPKGDSRPKLYI